MNALWKLLTSLRLTVWLLAISVVLVFLGSIAQVPEGLWNAQARWFKTFWVIRREGDEWWVPPVFPGGHLMGLLLLVNLLAAHLKRFSWSFSKFGIQLTHLGIIVMLVGQLITDKKAVESSIQFTEGETATYTQHFRDIELAFAYDHDEKSEEVVSFPESMVAAKRELVHAKLPFTVRVREFGVNGALLSLADMPTAASNVKRALTTLAGKFTTPEALPAIAEQDDMNPSRRVVWRKVLRAMGETDDNIVNAAKKIAADPKRGPELVTKLREQFRTEMLEVFANGARDELRFGQPQLGSESGYAAELEAAGRGDEVANLKASATNGVGKLVHAIHRPEKKGDSDPQNYKWAIIEIYEGGKEHGSWLVSSRLNKPQEIEAAGKKFRVSLRNERYPLTYGLQLVRARQEDYQGGGGAKSYSSRVRIINPNTKEDRETDINMNNPLRYEGLTFYQSSMNQMDRGPGTAALAEAITGRPRSEFVGLEEKEGGRFSGLQTVENPSMVAPYTGCLLVGFGMLWQFLYHLTGFLSKRTGLPSASFGVPHPLLPISAILIMVPDLFIGWIAIKNGSLFALAVVAVTPFIRGVLAWQVWQGKHLVFAMVLLLTPTALTIPFTIKYWDTHGAMLLPVTLAQLAAFAGIAYVVFTHNPRKAQPAIANA